MLKLLPEFLEKLSEIAEEIDISTPEEITSLQKLWQDTTGTTLDENLAKVIVNHFHTNGEE